MLSNFLILTSLISYGYYGLEGFDLKVIKSQKVDNSSLFWGTYRPNLYFGTRARTDESILTGLMWNSFNNEDGKNKIRHGCEQNEDLSKHGYLKHDGRLYANQEIEDNYSNFKIQTEFIKTPSMESGGDWAVKISGKPMTEGPAKLGIYYYIGMEGKGGMKVDLDKSTQDKVYITGVSDDFGEFDLILENVKSSNMVGPKPVGYITDPSKLWQVHNRLKGILNRIDSTSFDQQNESFKSMGKSILLDPELGFNFNQMTKGHGNLFIIQNLFEGEFEFNVIYNSKASKHEPITSSNFETKKVELNLKFDEKFEKVFGLQFKNFTSDQVEFAQACFSNLIGGTGYFHGDSIIKLDSSKLSDSDDENEDNDNESLFSVPEEEDNNEADDDENVKPEFVDETKEDGVKRSKPKSLLTAVPSRPFFPRGFFWDEGYHQLLISEWDFDLSLEVLSSWFNQMDHNGWIAREQILGDEARSKVPKEFQTQHQDYANPPTLYMVIEKFVDLINLKHNNHSTSDPESESFINGYGNDHFHPDIMTEKHTSDKELALNWLKNIYPKLKLNFQWFKDTQYGEIDQFDRECRGGNEAYRWRGRTGTHCLTSGFDDYPRPNLSNGELHVDLHCWMGLMSRILNKIALNLNELEDAKLYGGIYNDIKTNLIDLHWSEKDKSFCDLGIDSNGESIPICHKGYISILPLALGLIDANSTYYSSTLDLIHDPNQLWSDFGIRSLSAQSEYYYKDESYWRGPIWININYLVLSSLKRNYMNEDQLYKEKSELIYNELRQNLVSNLIKEYKRTGYVWEQYSAKDGLGQKSHPFTGWTSLIVMIMAEKY